MDDTATPRLRMLTSGSRGNCAFLQVGQLRLLIDAGLPITRLRAALDEIGVALEELDALVLTHEHSDHVRGLPRLLAARPELPIYATRGTASGVDGSAGWDLRLLKAQRCERLGEVDLVPFATSHDAEEPIGLRLEAQSAVVGYATDLGRWDEGVAEHLEGCDLLVVEANHDLDMLRSGPYPAFLKRRIASARGHLSNFQARALVERVACERLQHVVLAHLSEKNNAPELAQATIAAALAGSETQVHVAEQRRPGPLLDLVAASAPPRRLSPAQFELF